MNRQQQGDMGEASARCWYELHGYWVYVPTGHSPDADFLASDGERLLRVEVKTTGVLRDGRWTVSVCTRGGNQSWNRVVKRWSASRCDELFAVVADGRRWRIPAGAVLGATAISLGGRRYAEYEVQPGPPLIAVPALGSLRSSIPAG